MTETEVSPVAESESNEFVDAAQEGQIGFFAEFADFLLHNKKWWITPIVVVLLAVALLVMLAATPAAPFIYTIF
ncbi:MAG: hypothetical protein DWQ31_17860 [Planctomycetota bacterium]|nr:MAG: hypothetical protein DWQ31_17860 [Planctomycetota bacterium]REJ97348.1 MAG: hypothetical protein DWQ35_01980 [Planctomycetota bacterium]REK27741.1 MAG: hypothetical protein DWQ42_07190 [Planctomycetota bacterium]REK48118.1 MAG: hypothetical protein DWQ46_02830 [Planctomycetota bacterium]